MFHNIQYALWMDLSPRSVRLVSGHTSLQRVAAALMMASPVYHILIHRQKVIVVMLWGGFIQCQGD